MGKQLTVKEAKLVKAKAEGKTHVQAAKEAGYLPNASDRTIQTEVNNTLKKPHVKEALEVAFKKHGIDLDTAIAPIGKALKATKVVITGNDKDGHFAEVVEDIDLQLKGSDRALKLMGVSTKDGDGTTNYNFTQIINEKADKYAD